MKTEQYINLLKSLDVKTLIILYSDIQRKAHCGLCKNCNYNAITNPSHLPVPLNGCLYHDIAEILKESGVTV